jgi:hypothetical protein
MVLALYKRTQPVVNYNPEKRLQSVKFTSFKYNERMRPSNKSRIVIICCFSEFGCETIGNLYCLPRLLKKFPGKYVIVVGWYGREYLYRHLVDEFWEIDESFMWLRSYCKAFHHDSINLSRLENYLQEYAGTVIKSKDLGAFLILNFCWTCGKMWTNRGATRCPVCSNTLIQKGIFDNLIESKKTAVKMPRPKQELLEWANKLVGNNTVGIFARNRKTYGRNLTKEFYIGLIDLIKSKGYNVIWLGEKESTYPCPDPTIFDFSRMPEARELERTLAIVCNLKFTVQFFTASSRLAGMMGVPFLIVESPDQIYGIGQEGMRLELSTFGDRKLVLSDIEFFKENQEESLALVSQAVEEMLEGNFSSLIGMVKEEKEVMEFVKQGIYGKPN